MPVNGFSVGRDVSLTVTLSGGRSLSFSGLTNFKADPATTKLSSKGIDGRPRFGFIPDGWKGTFMLDRLDSTVDDWWAQVEADYFSGKNIPPATISEIVTEADGSVTEWRYTGVVLVLEGAGDWGGDKKVDQSVSFEAERKLKVA